MHEEPVIIDFPTRKAAKRERRRLHNKGYIAWVESEDSFSTGGTVRRKSKVLFYAGGVR